MKIVDLPLATSIKSKLQAIESFDTLNPPQQAVIEAGLFERKNFLVAIPTASGKTFIAELATLQHVLEFNSQVIYLTPLKALALEKFHDFKRFNTLGIKTGITLGDYDSSDTHLFDRCNVVISTNEKIDSLLRHTPALLQNKISLLIIDECHLIDDASRGPTLETLIVKIKKINPSIQLLALSATVHNAEEVAGWLGATLVQSNWRSVPVEEYFCNQYGIITHRNSQITRTVPSTAIMESLVKETLETNGQVLIFANSRKSAQNIATSLKLLANSYLSSSNKKIITSSINALIKKDQSGDKTSNSLLQLINHGVGFHHAGLSNTQRVIVESLFKQRTIKIIVATPTLAAGINLPARRVIIANMWRFSSTSGYMNPIKVMEYEQMRGRSGRPKYDKFGESFILATSDRDEEIVRQKYFASDGSEDIESKLSALNILRIHLLGVLSTGIVKTYSDLQQFLQDSFYGYQYNNFSLLERNLRIVTDDLEEFGFIKVRNELIQVTKLGRRVSQLYIDPVTANIIIKGMIKALRFPDYKPLMFIHLLCLVPDIRRIRIKKKEWGKLDYIYAEARDKLLSGTDVIEKFDTERDIEAFKTALIILDWIKEKPLPDILQAYDLTLGDFQRLQDTLVWLCYSAKELTKELLKISIQKDLTDFIYLESLQQVSEQDLALLSKYLMGLEIRVTEGIKEDLLKLIELKGLGRVKARELASHGIKNIDQLQKTKARELLKLAGFGPKLVMSLQEQLGKKIDLTIRNLPVQNNFKPQLKNNTIKKKASSLTDFVKE